MSDVQQGKGGFDVVVVGAGLAGLIAGTEAARSGARTLVLDAHREGGRARTTDRSGFLFNQGPHAVFEAGPFMALLKRWGLEPPGGSPTAKGTHMATGGVLHLLPTGPTTLARTHLLRPASRLRFARLMAALPRLDVGPLCGRSVTQWSNDEGLPDDVHALVLALVRITSYANAPDAMDAGAALAQLRRGLKGVRYVDGGWQRLVSGLAGALRDAGGRLRTGLAVAAVESDGVRAAVHAAAETIAAGTVILAGLPPVEVLRLLGDDGQARVLLDDLGPAVEACCLELGLAGPPPEPPLVLGLDQPLYLSVHAPVARLAPPGCAMVEVMKYLPPAWPQSAVAAEDDRGQLDALRRLVGIEDHHIAERRFLRRMTVAHAMPLARHGGLAGRPTVTTPSAPNVFIAGDWVGPEGILSDAVASSALGAAAAATVALRREPAR